jgi:hypothetical protein
VRLVVLGIAAANRSSAIDTHLRLGIQRTRLDARGRPHALFDSRGVDARYAYAALHVVPGMAQARPSWLAQASPSADQTAS